MNDMNLLEYKGYHTRVECSIEDGVLFGKIEGIRDLVTFECDTIAEAEGRFHAAVDDYLAFCADIGKEPEKEYKGQFNVRIEPELHREAAIEAFKKGMTLNAYIAEAIREKVKGQSRTVKYIIQPAPWEEKYETGIYSTLRRNFSYATKLHS
ncbi:MAG: type II toxin-antitoxin system HicB family antitoxin [Oscillospiraceae bacterium]|nr:type II toxin-antitoxin system HicB family antitoxin [Oscillospiraceae bacterium]